MTPRRIRLARRADQKPIVLRFDGRLDVAGARDIKQAWRRATRYPMVLVDDRFSAVSP